MLILREKYVNYTYLIACIFLIQVIGLNTVQALNCVQCYGYCKDDLNDASAGCTGSETYTKCFTQIDTNGKISRGCLTSANETTCTPEKNCVATEDGKNNQLICKTCNDADCSRTDASDNKYSKICEADAVSCFKKMNEKLVVRGCAKEADAAQCTGTTCEPCKEVNCNKGIYPSDRLQCYQCSNDGCNDVAASSSLLKACALLEENNQCYTKGESDKTMVRGCKSDTDGNKCPSIADGCAFCNKTGCNNLKYKVQPTLKCHQCTDSPDCFTSQNDTTLKVCSQEILYSDTEYCFTKIDGNKVERGCLHDKTDLTADSCNDADGGACNKCTGEGCNNKDVQFTCIACRSDTETKCDTDASQLNGTNCHTNPSSPKEGCFSGIWNGITIRGCLIDAHPQVQALCQTKNNPNRCDICHSKNCNIERSSGAQNKLALGLMSILLITLWYSK